jgi:hypothetical protein
MQKKTVLLSLVSALTLGLFLSACEKKKEIPTPVIIKPVTADTMRVSTTLITLPIGWVTSTSLSSGMPATAGVFEYNKGGIKAFAFIYDLNDTTIEFTTALNTARKTPTQWHTDATGNKLAVINAGYFDLTNGASYSVVVSNGVQLSPNVRALTRTFSGAATTYYPTRAAFGLSNGVPSVNWIYNTSGTTNYAYPQPSPNTLNAAPQPVPTAAFPAGGTLWQVNQGIGGSPMLLKNGNIQISDAEELIVVDNQAGRSRSALGYTANKRLVLLVIEKNSTRGTVGASLAEEAQLLKEMGCTDAINLDGGGSTCLLVNGNGLPTNLPEGGAQRAVSSVVVIKKK